MTGLQNLGKCGREDGDDRPSEIEAFCTINWDLSDDDTRAKYLLGEYAVIQFGEWAG